jgi:hypothetical protein
MSLKAQKELILETVTHNLAAVLIQILCFKYLLFPYNFIITGILAFLSHFLIDAASKFTYHTPEPHKDDKFWLVWHVIIYGVSFASIVIFFIPFWWSMILANFTDITDWLILRPIYNRKKNLDPETKWGKKYFFHPLVDVLRNKLFSWVPNWNYKKGGIVIELIIIFIFTILIILFI